jgi:hypothetical protein
MTVNMYTKILSLIDHLLLKKWIFIISFATHKIMEYKIYTSALGLKNYSYFRDQFMEYSVFIVYISVKIS